MPTPLSFTSFKVTVCICAGSILRSNLKFADVNGDGIISEKDRTMIGNPTPDFTYGFSVNLGYKNFDLSVDMMGVYVKI